MGKHLGFAGLLVIAAGLSVLTGHMDLTAGTANAKEEASIRAVLEAQRAAWNRGDVGGFMQGYWNAPELSFAGSTGFVRGWDNVTTRYKSEYPNQTSMGKLDFSELDTRMLGSDAALVLGKWHLTRTSGDVGGIFTLIFQRFPEGWKIVHDHTSVLRNPNP